MTNSQLEQMGREEGFDAVYFVPPEKFACNESDHLILDPQESLPGVNTIILLVKKCPLSQEIETADATISNYYIASNMAYRAAKRIAGKLNEKGYRSVSNVQIPIKQCMLRNGIGIRGENSLVYIGSFGSAVHIQTILTQAEFRFSHPAVQPAVDCINCGICIRACPTGAIRFGGIVDQSKCLRAVCEAVPVPEEFEKLMGNHLLGCEICQTVCPMNHKTERQKPYVVSLKKILKGDINELKTDIGINYARKNRLQMKACILSANNVRSDLAEDLKELTQGENEELSAAAKKAINRIAGKS